MPFCAGDLDRQFSVLRSSIRILARGLAAALRLLLIFLAASSTIAAVLAFRVALLGLRRGFALVRHCCLQSSIGFENQSDRRKGVPLGFCLLPAAPAPGTRGCLWMPGLPPSMGTAFFHLAWIGT